MSAEAEGQDKVHPPVRVRAAAWDQPVEPEKGAPEEQVREAAWEVPARPREQGIREEAERPAEQVHRAEEAEVRLAAGRAGVDPAPAQAAAWAADRVHPEEDGKIFFTHASMSLCLGLCLLMPGVASAQIGSNGILYGEGKRDTLRDLTGVEVVVESFEVEGFSSAHLKKEIESELEQAGIRVFRNKERLDQPGFPYLYVQVNVLRTDLIHSYGLEISLNQTVMLTRSPSISIFAPTWWAHASGAMSPLNVAALRATVHEYLRKFILAYQSVNAQDIDVLR